MNLSNKTLGIIAGTGATVALILSGYLTTRYLAQPQQVACTQEAKLCPDGTAVGRAGPKCEFAECPKVQSWDSPSFGTSTEVVEGDFSGADPETSEANFSGWQTYRNEEYGFEVKYPAEWPSPQLIKDLFYSQGGYPHNVSSNWRLNIGNVDNDFCEGTACYKYYLDGFKLNFIDVNNGLSGDELVKIITSSPKNETPTIQYIEGGICGYMGAFAFSPSGAAVRLSGRCVADNSAETLLFNQILATFKFIN